VRVRHSGLANRDLNASFRQWMEGDPTVPRVPAGLKAGYGMTTAQSVPVALSRTAFVPVAHWSKVDSASLHLDDWS